MLFSIRWAVGLLAMLVVLSGCASGPGARPQIETVLIPHPRLYLDKSEDSSVAGITKIGDRMVLNGPLFDDNGNPVGGYLTQAASHAYAPAAQSPFSSRSLSPVHADKDDNFDWHNQIFGQRANGAFFMKPYDSWIDLDGMARREQAVFVIQNGPALVINGYNIHDAASEHRASRIGIGYTRDNRLIVADSQDDVTMFELAEALLGQGAVNAIYLDVNHNGWIMDMHVRGHMPPNAPVLHVD